MFLATGAPRTQPADSVPQVLSQSSTVLPQLPGVDKKTNNIRAPCLYLPSCLHKSQNRYTPTLGFTRLQWRLLWSSYVTSLNTKHSRQGGGVGGEGLILFSPKFHSRTKGLFPMGMEIQVWHNPQTAPPMSFQEFNKATDPALIPNTNSKPHPNPNPFRPLSSLLTPQPSEFPPSTHLTLC